MSGHATWLTCVAVLFFTNSSIMPQWEWHGMPLPICKEAVAKVANGIGHKSLRHSEGIQLACFKCMIIKYLWQMWMFFGLKHYLCG